MRLKTLLFAVFASTTIGLVLENTAEAQGQKCAVNRYFACTARCRGKAWLRAPRRCKLFIELRQTCARAYEARWRFCVNKRRKWNRRVRCFRNARIARNNCYNAQWAREKYIHKRLRNHCRAMCSDWRPKCVRRCVLKVRNHCNAWASALLNQEAKCATGCRRTHCWFTWQ